MNKLLKLFFIGILLYPDSNQESKNRNKQPFAFKIIKTSIKNTDNNEKREFFDRLKKLLTESDQIAQKIKFGENKDKKLVDLIAKQTNRMVSFIKDEKNKKHLDNTIKKSIQYYYIIYEIYLDYKPETIAGAIHLIQSNSIFEKSKLKKFSLKSLLKQCEDIKPEKNSKKSSQFLLELLYEYSMNKINNKSDSFNLNYYIVLNGLISEEEDSIGLACEFVEKNSSNEKTADMYIFILNQIKKEIKNSSSDNGGYADKAINIIDNYFGSVKPNHKDYKSISLLNKKILKIKFNRSINKIKFLIKSFNFILAFKECQKIINDKNSTKTQKDSVIFEIEKILSKFNIKTDDF